MSLFMHCSLGKATALNLVRSGYFIIATVTIVFIITVIIVVIIPSIIVIIVMSSLAAL